MNHTEILHALARQVAEAHRVVPTARAAMVTGSVAKGLADDISDIDMAVYYDHPLPDDETLGRICAELGGTGRRPLGGPREDDGFMEAFELQGVEVQLIHSTISGWEATMDEVLVKFAVDTPLAKALEGILACKPFYGEDLIGAWKARAADFPPALGDAMIRRYLSFFPAWGFVGQFTTRDATVWYHQILVESSQNLLGVLAGLNHVYFTPFQHKRMARFIQQLSIAPSNLTQRIEDLFTLGPALALPALEALVGETVGLVEVHKPDIDVSAVKRRIGWRRSGWTAPS